MTVAPLDHKFSLEQALARRNEVTVRSFSVQLGTQVADERGKSVLGAFVEARRVLLLRLEKKCQRDDGPFKIANVLMLFYVFRQLFENYGQRTS